MAKFCTNCGNPLTGTEKFCTKCGQKVQANASPTSSKSELSSDCLEVHNNTHSTDKTKKIIIISSGIVLIGLIIFILLWATHQDIEEDYHNGEIQEEWVVELPPEKEDSYDTYSYDSPEVYNDNLNLSRYINSYPTTFSIRNLGKNWDWASDYHPEDVILFSEGILDKSFFRMVTYLTPSGYLYGRYYNDNGTSLDVNGYVKRNGNIEIQLGHKSEASYMTLSPSEDISTDQSFAYQGVWGKKKKSVDLIFYPNDSYFMNNLTDFSNIEFSKLHEDFINGDLDGDGIVEQILTVE